MREVDIADLSDCLRYDPGTGQIHWKVALNSRCKLHEPAGHIDPKGRVKVGFRGTSLFGHRVAFALMTGEWPPEQVDHINRDQSDNRWGNLRLAEPFENQGNKRGWSKSGFKGIERHRKGVRYRARIVQNGRLMRLGSFATAEEAARAYDRAARQYFGEFALTNFPE